MQPLNPEDISNHSKQTLQSMLIEESERNAAAMKMIKKLEKQIGSLCTELGAQNQKVLITAQTLDRMKDDKYGRKSESRRGEGTLFGEDESRQADGDKQPDKKPKKQREQFGRRAQPGLITQDVMVGIPTEQCEKFDLIEFEGQFEESEVITVIPSRIVLQTIKRKKYIKTDRATGERTIITAPPLPKFKKVVATQ